MCLKIGSFGIFLMAIEICVCVSGGSSIVPRYWDVRTTQGIVRGHYKPNPPHFAFLGLPYARSPTGYDRFKAPEPPPAWDGIFEGTYRVKCPQPDRSGSEDCLIVNVFVPAVNQTHAPVLVHFHDGHFQSGWGAHYAPSHFIDQNIIVITFNHRISAPGFLCLRSPGIPGNAGLKDQIAALYWVQRNIAQFRGNPYDITVYGTGSGAISIQLLLLSGASDELFHKTILESGSVLAPSSMTYNPVEDAFEAVKELGHKGDNDVNALQKIFYKTSVHKLGNLSVKWLPCLEKNSKLSLIQRDPFEVLSSGNFHKTPTIILFSNSKQTEIIADNKDRFNFVPDNFEPMLPNNLDIDNIGVKQKVATLTKNFYFHETESVEEILRGYMDYVNDIFSEYPIVTAAAYFAKKNIQCTFLMKFTYKMRNGSVSWEARHGDVFQLVYKNMNWEGPTGLVAHILRTMWVNFIKVGDPTPITTSLLPDVWIPISTMIINEKINYKEITFLDFGKSINNKDISTPQFAFWDHIYETFYKHYINF